MGRMHSSVASPTQAQLVLRRSKPLWQCAPMSIQDACDCVRMLMHSCSRTFKIHRRRPHHSSGNVNMCGVNREQHACICLPCQVGPKRNAANHVYADFVTRAVSLSCKTLASTCKTAQGPVHDQRQLSFKPCQGP